MKLWGNFLKYSGWKIPKFEEKHWLLDPRSSPNPSQEKHKESHIRHVWVKEQKTKVIKKSWEQPQQNETLHVKEE